MFTHRFMVQSIVYNCFLEGAWQRALKWSTVVCGTEQECREALAKFQFTKQSPRAEVISEAQYQQYDHCALYVI